MKFLYRKLCSRTIASVFAEVLLLYFVDMVRRNRGQNNASFVMAVSRLLVGQRKVDLRDGTNFSNGECGKVYTQRCGSCGFSATSFFSAKTARGGVSSWELLSERDGDSSRDRAGEGSRDPGSLSLVEYQEYSESSSPLPLFSSSMHSAIVSIPATMSRVRVADEDFFFFLRLRRFFSGFETGTGT